MQDEIAATTKEDKKQRLTRKLDLVREQMDRASWLQDRIDSP